MSEMTNYYLLAVILLLSVHNAVFHLQITIHYFNIWLTDRYFVLNVSELR